MNHNTVIYLPVANARKLAVKPLILVRFVTHTAVFIATWNILERLDNV